MRLCCAAYDAAASRVPVCLNVKVENGELPTAFAAVICSLNVAKRGNGKMLSIARGVVSINNGDSCKQTFAFRHL